MSKKIVVLDGYPLNPGDLSWDSLRALLPNVEIHERTSAGDVLSRCADAEIILTNKVRLSAETLRELPKLRYIGVLATGFDVVDAVVARTQDIVVCNIPAYGTRSVVQLVFAYILHWSNAVASHAVRVRGGAWTQSQDWSFWDSPLHELAGKTLGITLWEWWQELLCVWFLIQYSSGLLLQLLLQRIVQERFGQVAERLLLRFARSAIEIAAVVNSNRLLVFRLQKSGFYC
jgi:hypothetical protein